MEIAGSSRKIGWFHLIMPMSYAEDLQLDWRLVFLNGERAGESIVLAAQNSPISLGREPTCAIPIEDPAASRVHAELSCEGGLWRIKDCTSSNGTQVNSCMINQKMLLAGDLIKVGEQMLVVCTGLNVDADKSITPRHLIDDTCVRRVSGIEKLRLANEPLAADSTRGTSRKLGLLYRFSRDVLRAANLDQLWKKMSQTIRQGIQAELVKICLRGADGTLISYKDADDLAIDHDSAEVLSNWVVETDEALLLDLDGNGDPQEKGRLERGNAMGVPVPGESQVLGAIECVHPRNTNGFQLADLEFVLAVAQQFGLALERLRYQEQIEASNQNLRYKLKSNKHKLLGTSKVMQELLDKIRRVAASDSTVLVLGESGTGKELVAETIHEFSSRHSGPFVAVNCAAIAEALLESELFGHEKGAFTGADSQHEGQFERAHHGTLLLDEVGEMSLSCQAKLLRILEGHSFLRVGGRKAIRVDVRIIAATHRDLKEMVESGSFREDLWYRLSVIELVTPPLRERGGDTEILAEHFLEQYRRELGRTPAGLSDEARLAISNYSWPGNVRELRNSIERAIVLGTDEFISSSDLGLSGDLPRKVDETDLLSLAEIEQRHIAKVFESVGENKSKACRVLGITRATLYKKLNQ